MSRPHPTRSRREPRPRDPAPWRMARRHHHRRDGAGARLLQDPQPGGDGRLRPAHEQPQMGHRAGKCIADRAHGRSPQGFGRKRVPDPGLREGLTDPLDVGELGALDPAVPWMRVPSLMINVSADAKDTSPDGFQSCRRSDRGHSLGSIGPVRSPPVFPFANHSSP